MRHICAIYFGTVNHPGHRQLHVSVPHIFPHCQHNPVGLLLEENRVEAFVSKPCLVLVWSWPGARGTRT